MRPKVVFLALIVILDGFADMLTDGWTHGRTDPIVEIRLIFLRKYKTYRPQKGINLFPVECFTTYISMIGFEKKIRNCQGR